MLKRSMVVILTLSALMLHVEAGEIHCRSGVVKAAQLTRQNLSIANLNPLAFPGMPANKIFAVVSIKPDDLRSISIFDYSLEAYGVSFPCAAVRRSGRFEYFTGDINASGIQQLLFVLDGAMISGNQKVENLVLRSNLADPGSIYRTSIPFSFIGNRPPTAPESIAPGGALEIEE